MSTRRLLGIEETKPTDEDEEEDDDEKKKTIIGDELLQPNESGNTGVN